MKELIIKIILVGLLTYIGYKKKAFTKVGLLISFLLALIIALIDLNALILFIIMFILLIISDKIGKKPKLKIEKNIENKTSKRDTLQVLSNLIIPTISLTIFYITKSDLFKLIYIATLGSSLSDAFSSNLGPLSKQEPINIITLKKEPKGLSGSITILGLIASLLAAILLTTTTLILYKTNITINIKLILLMLMGSVIDSILGALIQVKYICPKCNQKTEKEIHCKYKTLKYKGFKLVNNDIINVTTSIIIFILSFIILK